MTIQLFLKVFSINDTQLSLKVRRQMQVRKPDVKILHDCKSCIKLTFLLQSLCWSQ